ncbi:MAG: hypothetical protein ACTSR4_07435 [Candidatus Hodarchaeales archaeon]|jgi:hypothetical protein
MEWTAAKVEEDDADKKKIGGFVRLEFHYSIIYSPAVSWIREAS